jgi:hypothetical protein
MTAVLVLVACGNDDDEPAAPAPPDADGWIGGRAHNLVIPLQARP